MKITAVILLYPDISNQISSSRANKWLCISQIIVSKNGVLYSYCWNISNSVDGEHGREGKGKEGREGKGKREKEEKMKERRKKKKEKDRRK